MAKHTQPDLVLGTAGHIDHGKSSLIMALTGTDPDRLAEEKSRGITIELGFAQLILPDGRTMGVVDVPGHERFVRQMIAGSTGIDVALLVIAADDGVMPQTQEHVAVLQTLGITSCVVALTKIDLVDDDWVEFMTGEVRTYLQQTSYADAPIIPVSSKTGSGLDDLRNAIQAACAATARTKQGTTLRLPIDRVFTIKGAGTVVTGTLWSGTARIDDPVEILPQGIICRIRSVQEHGEPVDYAQAGNRVALNLNGVKTDEVRPGDFLATPHTLQATDRFDARLTYLDTAKTGKPLKTGSRMHIAHGTRESLGRVLFCDDIDALAPGQSAFAQVRLEEPLPVSYGDRFIIRTYSPMMVAGGGTVLLAHPRRRTTLSADEHILLQALDDHEDQTAVEAALRLQHLPVQASALAESLGMNAPQMSAHLDAAVQAKHALRLGTASDAYYTTQTARQRLVASIDRTLVDFHTEHPDATGMSKDALRQAIDARCTPACFDVVLAEASSANVALVVGGEVGHPRASGAARKAEEEAANTLLAALQSAGMAPPTVSALAEQAGIPLPTARKALAVLEHTGAVCRVSSELYFDAQQVEACKRAIAEHLNAEGDGTAASLRDVVGASRKYALPLLEYFDSIGFTTRKGDVRILKSR